MPSVGGPASSFPSDIWGPWELSSQLSAPTNAAKQSASLPLSELWLISRDQPEPPPPGSDRRLHPGLPGRPPSLPARCLVFVELSKVPSAPGRSRSTVEFSGWQGSGKGRGKASRGQGGGHQCWRQLAEGQLRCLQSRSTSARREGNRWNSGVTSLIHRLWRPRCAASADANRPAAGAPGRPPLPLPPHNPTVPPSTHLGLPPSRHKHCCCLCR